MHDIVKLISQDFRGAHGDRSVRIFLGVARQNAT